MTGRVLADGPLFFYTDEGGDLPTGAGLGYGLYFLDTRHLSAFTVEIAGQAPILLASSADSASYQTIQLANPYFLAGGREVLPETISIRRNRIVDGALHERIGIFNYNRFEVLLDLALTFAADFRDILDVRGLSRGERGQLLEPTFPRPPTNPEVSPNPVSLSYRGADGLVRRTDILIDLAPVARDIVAELSLGTSSAALLSRLPRRMRSSSETPPVPGVRLRFKIALQPSRPRSIGCSIHPSVERQVLPRPRINFDLAAARLRREYEERWAGNCTSFATENDSFNRLLHRSLLDLRALLTRQPSGPLLIAGLPWAASPTGRDALLAAEHALALNPEIAVGALRFLAERQGSEDVPKRDEEPGKILQQVKVGDLARPPGSLSYSSPDPTPLFVSLFCRAMDWLGDDNLFEELRPSVLRAVDWIDRYGDRDGDGLLEAGSRSADGPVYPVWRGSADAYSFPDGKLAEGPLVPIELQGYVRDAKARLARLLGRGADIALAERLFKDAERLSDLIHALYWMPDEGYYAAALDGRKMQVPLVTSAAGHLLWADAISPERAAPIVRRLLAEDLFSGWGIRTVSSLSQAFNPMSYHNGSVWLHDGAMIVAGLRRFGYDEPALRVGGAMCEALLRLGSDSVPELFCGFPRDRRSDAVPSPYLLACAPHARASGAVFSLLASFLGLVPDATHHRLAMRPRIPESLGAITVRNLRVGRASVDFVAGPSGTQVLAQRGDLEVFAQ